MQLGLLHVQLFPHGPDLLLQDVILQARFLLQLQNGRAELFVDVISLSCREKLDQLRDDGVHLKP